MFFKQKTAYYVRISYWSSAVCSSDLKIESAIAFVAWAVGQGDRGRIHHQQAKHHQCCSHDQHGDVETGHGGASGPDGVYTRVQVCEQTHATSPRLKANS